MKVGISKKLKPFALQKARYKVAFGGRASGKSWGVARILLLMAKEKPIRILCTREIQNSIKESVHRLLADQIDMMKMQGWVVQNDSIRYTNGSEFIFKGLYTNIEKIKSLEGVDICWIEEAETISEASWNILDPTIRKDGSEIWITFNPRFEEDTIYQKFILGAMPDSLVVQLNYIDNPHCSPEILKQAQHMEQTERELYRHIWLGECKKIADTRVFSMGELQEAMKKTTVDDIGETIWGLDVARFGDDRTVLAERRQYYVPTLHTWQGLSTVEVADRVHTLYNTTDRKPDAIFIDTIGVGGGVLDQLATRGLPVIESNSSAKADDPQYINKRAEMYMTLKQKMRFLKIPDNNDLLRELLHVEYLYTSAGKTQIISKDIIKKNYGKSPDLADAVALTFFSQIYQAGHQEDWRGGY